MQHPGIVITQSVVTQCQKNNTAIIFCDEKYLPLTVTLPLWEGHSLHTKVLRDQIAVKESTRKRLWQQIVRNKIAEQACTLELMGQTAIGLHRLHKKVRTGDPDNCEAQAARQYWPLLMGKEFRRNPDSGGENAILNYGYSIMRAMVARALVGTGLHPALGLYHKNQYNGLCLADDLMEPFRPWVDWQVRSLLLEGGDLVICRESKQVLLSMLTMDVEFSEKRMPLSIALHLLAATLKKALLDTKQKLVYPQRI